MISLPPNHMTLMKSCWMRAERFEGWGDVTGHKLEPAFRNYMWMADAGPNPDVEDRLSTLVCLAKFAYCLDEYAKTHMLDGDRAIAKMLQSWKRRCFFNPVILAG